MEMGVDQPWHEGVPASVNGNRSGVLDRIVADFLNDAVSYQDILMGELAAVADDDMNVFDQVSVRHSLFGPT